MEELPLADSRNRLSELVAGVEKTHARVNPMSDLVAATKKSYDRSLHTDLEHALRPPGGEPVLLTGINTNNRVLATLSAPSVRDFAAFVMSDWVATLDPQLYHSALDVIDGAFGRVIESTRAPVLACDDRGPVHA